MYKFSEKTPQPLDQCSDETLCQLVAGGSREAEEALVTVSYTHLRAHET